MQTTGRHGFLLPEITDDNPTPNAVVRDSFRANATLSDRATFFDATEVVTGKWEFAEAILADKGSAVILLNNSGGARAVGDVVMLDPAVDQAFITPNAAPVDAGRVLIVAEAIAGGAVGRCTMLGIIRLKAAAGTLRGQYLQTQNASVIAVGSTNITPGSFGLALTGLDGANTVLAAVHAGGAGGGLEVAEVDAAPDIIGTRKLVFPNGSLTDLGSQTIQVAFGSSVFRREQYTVTGTTQVLGLVPDTILSVSKNGLEQTSGVDYTLAAATLTFTTALVADKISVVYVQTNSFNPSSAPYIQEFDPAAAATVINIANVPTTIMFVLRNGVAQSQTKGDWTWGAGTTVVTFSDPFVAGEHVIIGYAQNFGGGNAASVNGLPAVPSSAPAANSLVGTDVNGRLPASVMPTTTSYREEFQPANAATTVVLSQAPGAVLYVARDGVIQSIADGHYTLAGSTLTFTDAFDGVSRVVVGYILGTNIGAANTVGGFSASSDAVATPGTLVATNAVSGKLPSSILSPMVNQAINGGFEIWQRGNGPFTTTALFTADRWSISLTGGSTMSVSKEGANVDNSSGAAAVLTYVQGSQNAQFFQKSEDYLQLRGRTVSFSFRVRGSVGAAVRAYVYDTVNGFTYSPYHSGSGNYETLTVVKSIAVGATFITLGIDLQVSGTYYVDNAMLAISAAPVDYQPLTPADELARCLRYYEHVFPGSGDTLLEGIATGAGQSQRTIYPMKAIKSLSPTITKVGTWNTTNCGQAAFGSSSSNNFWWFITSVAAGEFFTQNAIAGNDLTMEANP